MNYSSERLQELNPEIDQDDWQRPADAASNTKDLRDDPAERPLGKARSEERRTTRLGDVGHGLSLDLMIINDP